jgi:hypothetical protein
MGSPGVGPRADPCPKTVRPHFQTIIFHFRILRRDAMLDLVQPGSALLQTGSTQTFTAAVSGTSNGYATWSATGGTISADGVYTAGNSSGNFTVTATSAADPFQQAQATVQITPAPFPAPPPASTGAMFGKRLDSE